MRGGEHVWATRHEFALALFALIEAWHNLSRCHSSIKMLSSSDFELQMDAGTSGMITTTSLSAAPGEGQPASTSNFGSVAPGDFDGGHARLNGRLTTCRLGALHGSRGGGAEADFPEIGRHSGLA